MSTKIYWPIDPGFGHWKAKVNDRTIKFSNVTGNHNFSKNGMSGYNDRPLSIKVDGLGAWNFGKTAVLQSTSPSRKQANDRIFSPEYLAGILLAISEGYSGHTREIECSVITGLPGSDFNRDDEYKAKFKKFVAGQYHIERPGYKQRITINEINFTQQAWGAIWRLLIDSKGNPIKPDAGRADEVFIGCVNVGYNTLEIGEVRVYNLKSGKPRIEAVEGKQLSTAHGVHTIIDQLIVDLANKFDTTFETEKAIEVLENGGLVFGGHWQDYQLPDNIKNELSETVYDGMTNVWQSGTSFLYRLILTGGGSHIVKDRFDDMPQLAISDNPQFDTVTGYGRLAKMVFRGR